MKNAAIPLTLLTLIINCSAGYALSSASTENAWATGYYSGLSEARSSGQPTAVPEPVVTEPGGDDGSAAGLGAGLALQKPAAKEPSAEIPEDLKAQPEGYDLNTALRLARNARNHSIGAFTGWCYSYVADAMEMTGIIRPGQWGGLGIGIGAAADFAYWANNNPGVLRRELGLARIPTPSRGSDLPMGAIVVYNRGVCGFSSRSGHIEVKVAPNLLCSDGCQPAYQECFGSPGVRAGISVYVPVFKGGHKAERRVCGLAGSGDGKCSYKCADGSDYEMPMKRPSVWDQPSPFSSGEVCKQVVTVF